jgi:octaprenyl-diphosphate synthase
VELAEATYFRVIEDKTAALYAAALRCGAEIADAPAEQSDRLASFGTRMGTAFQIVDDILDLTGDESAVGKSLGTDLDKAKMTLPLLRLRDCATPDDRRKVVAAILSDDPQERRSVLKLLEEYGAVASARETAETLVAEAHRDLDQLPASPERELLTSAAAYVLARDR